MLQAAFSGNVTYGTVQSAEWVPQKTNSHYFNSGALTHHSKKGRSTCKSVATPDKQLRLCSCLAVQSQVTYREMFKAQ